MKKRNHILPLVLMTVLAAIFLASCGENEQTATKTTHADSLITAAYQQHDYDKLLALTEQLQSSDDLSEMKANYWMGYAYSRQRKMKLAENYWKKAIALEAHNSEDMAYYAKSANRLSGLLLLRGEYEATLRVAMPAIEKMKATGDDFSSDYVFLLTTIGCCQLRLGNSQEADEYFNEAVVKYQEIISNDSDISNFNTAIASIITITDNCLQQKDFEQARVWTEHFDRLLQSYANQPAAKPEYLDKNRARLCFYRACALEGLGYRKEAAAAYKEALQTDYAQTDDGLLEATGYLTQAQRWGEAARNFGVLDNQMHKYNVDGMRLDNIQHYVLPKFRANMGAHLKDSALAVAVRIEQTLDSAIARNQKDDAAELATIYNTQQKEAEISRQKADLARQRFLATAVALVLVIVFFVLFIYVRNQSAKRLEAAYNKLAIANAKAEESSRMKTAFIQQISHEIRTPLNILSGFTQIITTPGMELDDATRQDVNEKISENTNRITGLVNKMLELSDASSRSVIERTDSIPAIQIAAQAAEDSGIGNCQHIKFDLQVADEATAAMLTTNLQQATRALALLLDNGKKFTKQGTVVLKVGMQPSVVQFVVEDTGIGVPPAEAEHIFEEFVQLDDYQEGTGIGLTVARSICRRLGGDVVLDTSYSGGARFVMTLPA